MSAFGTFNFIVARKTLKVVGTHCLCTVGTAVVSSCRPVISWGHCVE